ncbi:MAG TPA: VWA domain-containing protein [Candidatus Acidoferrales bacterium]|nr:VWA domain-containing protein [Candidatus Acidoferrales bacterium]
MEFLNPTALYAFALLPLLAIPYLLRARPKRVVFSSLVILRDLIARPQGRGWTRLRLPPIFFLQLLLLALLFFTMGEPVLSLHPTEIALVLDNSASMQAREDGRSRFEIARAEASRQIRGLSPGARIDFYVTVPTLEQVGGRGLKPAQAQALLRTLQPYDLPDRGRDPGGMLAALAKSKNYDRVFFITDHRAERQDEIFRVISVGTPKDNVALGPLRVAPAALGSARLRAQVEVRSFSRKEEKVRVSVNGGGKTLASRAVALPAGEVLEVSFDDLPLAADYEAVLAVDDALALDNRRLASAPSARGWKVLAVSPRPQALQSLRSIPGIALTAISPADYGSYQGRDHALEIFHYSMPQALPPRHALFVLPPADNPLAELGPAVPEPVISAWQAPHPLTDYVNFSLFRPSYARVLAPRTVAQAVLESPAGALALAFEQRGFRYLVLGFDPFPYLGRENLPMSIFTLNVLRWFYGELDATENVAGAPIAISPRPQQGSVILPNGASVALKANATEFDGTLFQGRYQVIRGAERDWFTVNFDSAAESDLLNPLTVVVPEAAGSAAVKPGLFRLWSVLLLAAAGLLLLERFLNPPSLRPARAR